MDKPPVQLDNKTATFKALCDQLGLDSKVLALFTASPMEDLQDFRFSLTEDKELDLCVAGDNSIKENARAHA